MTTQAPTTATEAATLYGGTPRLVVDNSDGTSCWLAFEDDRSALVVYADEPDCLVSTGNAPGRFSPATFPSN